MDSALGAKKSSTVVESTESIEYRDLEPEKSPEEGRTGDESSDEESLLSYQKDSNSRIVLENARLIIDTLYKLSFKIRDPTTRLGSSKAREYQQIDVDTGVDLMDAFIPLDLRHIAEIFSHYLHQSTEDCEDHFLVQRIARANTHRRRQFAQWRNHMIKLEKSDRAPALLSLAKLNMGPTQGPLNEQGPSSLPSTATKFEESKINFLETSSVRSSSTVMTLSRDDKEDADFHIPPLPEDLRDRNEFQCPYCHILCAKRTSNQSSWE